MPENVNEKREAYLQSPQFSTKNDKCLLDYLLLLQKKMMVIRELFGVIFKIGFSLSNNIGGNSRKSSCAL